MARLYLLSPRTLVRDALAALLQRAGHRVVGADGDPAVAATELAAVPVDLLLADVQAGCQPLASLLAHAPAAPGGRGPRRIPCVVLLGPQGVTADAQKLPATAVWGWVTHQASSRCLCDTLAAAIEGDRQPPPWQRTPSTLPAPPALGETERQVLALAAQGRHAAEIARTLQLAPWTVAQYRRDAMRRLGLRGMPSLVRYAMAHGLIGVRD